MKLQNAGGKRALFAVNCRMALQNEFPVFWVGLQKAPRSAIMEGRHDGLRLYSEVFDPMEFRRMTVEEIKRSLVEKLTSNFGCDPDVIKKALPQFDVMFADQIAECQKTQIGELEKLSDD